MNTGMQVDKRLAILRAATEVLVEEGLQALSFERVALRADLSRQLVRYYFADQDALMIALCDHMAESYREALITGIAKVKEPHRLDFFLDFFFGLADSVEMPRNLQAYDAMFAYAVGSQKLREGLRTHYELLGHVVEHELAIAYPQIKGAAAKELSFLFVSQMHAHWSFSATLKYAPSHNLVAREAFARLIEVYASTPSHNSDGLSWSKSE